MADSHRQLRLCLFAIIGLAIFALVMRVFFSLYQVHGNGMEPSLKDDGLYLVITHPLSLKRGDIVVFRAADTDQLLVKRVIGLPNEKIEIKESKVYVNGEWQDEPYVTRVQGINDYAIVDVPENHYYLLSDDRTDTWDSRQMGSIHKDQLLGKLIY